MARMVGFIAASFVGWTLIASRADQVVMVNGDTLNGKVIGMNTNVLVLQNENFGAVAVPRTKIYSIVFATATISTNALSKEPATTRQTNAAPDLATELRGISGQTNLIQQVQAQFLGSAGPDAVNKFNELLDGLSTGKIGLNDLRAQAQSTADQLRSLTNGMGPDVAEEAKGYLSILDNFLQETAPPNASTNTAAP